MKQTIIVFSGLPGSGKSTLAEAVASELKLPLLSVDLIESAIISAGISKGYKTGLAAYLVAQKLAAQQILLGNSVIIDAVSAEEAAKDTWRELVRGLQLPLTVFEVCVDEIIHRRRVESRVRNLHGMPEVTWADVLERRGSYTEWLEPVRKIDSENDIDANTRVIIDYLESV